MLFPGPLLCCLPYFQDGFGCIPIPKILPALSSEGGRQTLASFLGIEYWTKYTKPSFYVDPISPAIGVTPLVYIGGPSFRGNGEMFVPNPGPIRYVGTPSQDVDDAWESLTCGNLPSSSHKSMGGWLSVGRHFLVTEDEAHDAFGDGYEKYWNEQVEGYEVG
jgi:hypothetical protein